MIGTTINVQTANDASASLTVYNTTINLNAAATGTGALTLTGTNNTVTGAHGAITGNNSIWVDLTDASSSVNINAGGAVRLRGNSQTVTVSEESTELVTTVNALDSSITGATVNLIGTYNAPGVTNYSIIVDTPSITHYLKLYSSTINLSAATRAIVSLSGTNNTVIGAYNDGTYDSTMVELADVGASVIINAGGTVLVQNNNQTVTLAGTGSKVKFASISIAGTTVIFSVGGQNFNVQSGVSLTITSSSASDALSNTINFLHTGYVRGVQVQTRIASVVTLSGTNNNVTGSLGEIDGITSSWVKLMGAGSSVNINAGGAVRLQGNNQTVTLVGSTGSTVKALDSSITGATVNMGVGTGATLKLYSSTINLNTTGYGVLTLSGTNNIVTGANIGLSSISSSTLGFSKITINDGLANKNINHIFTSDSIISSYNSSTNKYENVNFDITGNNNNINIGTVGNYAASAIIYLHGYGNIINGVAYQGGKILTFTGGTLTGNTAFTSLGYNPADGVANTTLTGYYNTIVQNQITTLSTAIRTDFAKVIEQQKTYNEKPINWKGATSVPPAPQNYNDFLTNFFGYVVSTDTDTDAQNKKNAIEVLNSFATQNISGQALVDYYNGLGTTKDKLNDFKSWYEYNYGAMYKAGLVKTIDLGNSDILSAGKSSSEGTHMYQNTDPLGILYQNIVTTQGIISKYSSSNIPTNINYLFNWFTDKNNSANNYFSGGSSDMQTFLSIFVPGLRGSQTQFHTLTSYIGAIMDNFKILGNNLISEPETFKDSSDFIYLKGVQANQSAKILDYFLKVGGGGVIYGVKKYDTFMDAYTQAYKDFLTNQFDFLKIATNNLKTTLSNIDNQKKSLSQQADSESITDILQIAGIAFSMGGCTGKTISDVIQITAKRDIAGTARSVGDILYYTKAALDIYETVGLDSKEKNTVTNVYEYRKLADFINNADSNTIKSFADTSNQEIADLQNNYTNQFNELLTLLTNNTKLGSTTLDSWTTGTTYAVNGSYLLEKATYDIMHSDQQFSFSDSGGNVVTYNWDPDNYLTAERIKTDHSGDITLANTSGYLFTKLHWSLNYGWDTLSGGFGGEDSRQYYIRPTVEIIGLNLY